MTLNDRVKISKAMRRRERQRMMNEETGKRIQGGELKRSAFAYNIGRSCTLHHDKNDIGLSWMSYYGTR